MFGWIVIFQFAGDTYDPVAYGPFDSRKDAESWIESITLEGHATWTIKQLQYPAR